MRKQKRNAEYKLGALVVVFLMALAECGGFSLRSGDATASDTTVKSTPKNPQSSEQKENTSLASQGVEIPAPLKDRAEMVLRRTGYTVSYNADTRLPNWVAWRLTADRITGPAERKGFSFQEDTDVDEPRASTRDYVRSGYDRGHMCPAGDNKWNRQAMKESFLMTNVCPQNHGLNRGDWNEMEQQCRVWAEKYGEVYVVAGPILYGRKKRTTIGEHRVVVPDAFFKVVLCLNGKPRGIGFIYKNTDGNRPKGDYVNSIDEVERITGMDFFPSLPDDVETAVEARHDLADW